MFQRSRASIHGGHDSSDPLSGVANLFDVSVVFIVGLLIALFTTYRVRALLDTTSEVTMVTTNAAGEQEILIKKGKSIEAYRLTQEQMGQGNGQRLGTAYRLETGEVIYVPEGTTSEEKALAPAPK